MANPYKDAPQVKLADYIPADKFRTILPECRHIGGGISEIAAEIQVSEKFARKLSFYVSWDGLLYGFVRRKRELEADVMGGKKIKTVFIQDWDDKFLILFEGAEKDEEKAFLHHLKMFIICWKTAPEFLSRNQDIKSERK